MRQGGQWNLLAAILIGTLSHNSAFAESENGPVEQVGRAYPRLNAPLYPAPVQYTPPWNGAAIITNQALSPHEMLYPHEYRAMYPPFYHRVKGHWIVTPFGVKQNETWRLQGTEVKVNYRAYRNPFARFFYPPH